jgi:hypothetical protein
VSTDQDTQMARDLAEKLRTSQAALKRAELMVTLAVGVVREHGTPEGEGHVEVTE